MYDIPCFKEEDPGKVIAFMKAHPFALLTGCIGDRPVATQVPVLIDEEDGKLRLQAHIMRNTDHHKAFAANQNILLVFTGAHTYVSARWYTDPQNASTWNYRSVQVRGKIRFMDESGLLDLLKRTTEQFEADPHSPASFERLPEAYVARHAKAITGFEVEVTSIEHVFKLSQNRDDQSYREIVTQLGQGSTDARQVAEAMKEKRKGLFE